LRILFEAVWSAVTIGLALVLVVFILWFAVRLHAHMWRRVAARYRGTPASAAVARKLETMVIAARDMRTPDRLGSGAYRQYPALMLAAHAEGLALSLVPPFNIMCPPLFLRFDEMELKQTEWALWPDPFVLRMRALPDVDIIVGRDTVRWLREYVDRSPFGWGV
jgi:hypothetical protein